MDNADRTRTVMEEKRAKKEEDATRVNSRTRQAKRIGDVDTHRLMEENEVARKKNAAREKPPELTERVKGRSQHN